MSITVDLLQTGTIRIRPSHRSQSARRPVWLRRLRVLTDRRWTEPLPINTYLVDHPEGCILFDCGESPRASHAGYFPRWQPFFHLAVDIHISPQDGIGARLAARDIDPKKDLKAVVLSLWVLDTRPVLHHSDGAQNRGSMAGNSLLQTQGNAGGGAKEEQGTRFGFSMTCGTSRVTCSARGLHLALMDGDDTPGDH